MAADTWQVWHLTGVESLLSPFPVASALNLLDNGLSVPESRLMLTLATEVTSTT
jgi:hypothetical protein